jgi:transposase
MGAVHTNTIEGFWSLVKRGIFSVHHAVSAKYL